MNLEDIQSLRLDKHKFYFVSPCGLGDTMIICGLKQALEKKLGGKIHLIIKASHVIIMKMYKIKDYTVFSAQNRLNQFFCENSLFQELGNRTPIPEKGKIYMANPIFHTSYTTPATDILLSGTISTLKVLQESTPT